ncbi:MAG: hypothetical protein AB7I50_20355 [Vicinamibacterales bacterium]
MNVPHLHLLLNHFPTIGTIIGLGLLFAARMTRGDELRRAGLTVFFGLSVIAIPTYLTGNAADRTIDGLAGVSLDAITRHEDAAIPAFLLMELTGGLAWLALWQYRRLGRFVSGTETAVLVLALATFGFMSRAATLGGEIRHPEIFEEGAVRAEAGSGWFSASRIDTFVTDNAWVWPTSEAIHFVGLCVLVGIVLLINLRLLGWLRAVPLASLHRLLPFGVLAFGLNALSGMLFFVAAPEQYSDNVTFYWKILFILIAAAVLFYVTVFEQAWEIDAGREAPVLSKAVAVCAIVAWVGVIYCGQMLPFLGNAF